MLSSLFFINLSFSCRAYRFTSKKAAFFSNALGQKRFYAHPKGTKAFARRRNEEIGEKQIVLIDERGLNQGIKSTAEVLATMNREIFELSEVGKRDDLIVCKISNILKPKTAKEGRQQAANHGPSLSSEALLKQARVEKETPVKVKELQFATQISDHDLSYRLEQLEGFLKKGYHVEISIKGREERDTAPGKFPAKQKIMDKIMAFAKPLCTLKAAAKPSTNLLVFTLIGTVTNTT